MREINFRSEKSRLIGVLTVLVVLVGFVSWDFYFINRYYGPVDPEDKSCVDLIIPENSNARQVAAILKTNDLVYSETAFLTYVRKGGFDNKLLAGHYRFSRSQALKEIVDMITNGKVVNISFTIPEGYTVRQIEEMLVKKGIVTEEEWAKAIKENYDYEFLKDIPLGVDNRLEGFLFPDTYLISEDTTAKQIINLILNNFKNVWEKEFAGQACTSNMNIKEIITLASLIEKEAMIDEERKTIAGVIVNRLEKGMLLQIDATVLYCMSEHQDVVTYADLEVDSYYNTYKYAGLPPGPIACPGRASIKAALNPEKHSYFYYCSRGDGSHCFSKTYAEHLRAKNKYID